MIVDYSGECGQGLGWNRLPQEDLTVDFYKLDKDKTFLISQKALVTDADKLLVLEGIADNDMGDPKWELPGGLLEVDESLPIGLLREVREETGLVVSIGKLFAVWDHWQSGFAFRDGRVLDVRIIGLAFACQRMSGEIHLSDEHRSSRWMNKEELKSLCFAANSSFAIQKYLSEPL